MNMMSRPMNTGFLPSMSARTPKTETIFSGNTLWLSPLIRHFPLNLPPPSPSTVYYFLILYLRHFSYIFLSTYFVLCQHMSRKISRFFFCLAPNEILFASNHSYSIRWLLTTPCANIIMIQTNDFLLNTLCCLSGDITFKSNLYPRKRFRYKSN